MENVICHLVRSDSEASEQVWRTIRTEAKHWAAVEKDAAKQNCWAIQIDQEVAEAELQKAYLQKKQPDKIQAATCRARAAEYELKRIQQLKAAGLTSSSPNNHHSTDEDFESSFWFFRWMWCNFSLKLQVRRYLRSVLLCLPQGFSKAHRENARCLCSNPWYKRRIPKRLSQQAVL